MYITEGVGISDVLINKSTKSDVESRFGEKYRLIKHNRYSYEMKYDNLGLSFFYCLRDLEKKIFLIETYHGATSKGIVIGQSTLKDIFDNYGKEEGKGGCDSGACFYQYKGIQFYLVGDTEAKDDSIDPLQIKVVQIDVVSPDKSSNFCDDI